MTKKKIVQLIAITFLLIAVILLIPQTKWSQNTSVLGFISLVCGTFGSILSIFIPTNYIFHFTENDWTKNLEGDYSLLINSKKHGLGKSRQVQTYLKNGETFEEVVVSTHQDKKGNITIGANSIFKGKLIIT